MQSEFTAIIEEAPESGYWARRPKMPGANESKFSIGEVRFANAPDYEAPNEAAAIALARCRLAPAIRLPALASLPIN